MYFLKKKFLRRSMEFLKLTFGNFFVSLVMLQTIDYTQKMINQFAITL